MVQIGSLGAGRRRKLGALLVQSALFGFVVSVSSCINILISLFSVGSSTHDLLLSQIILKPDPSTTISDLIHPVPKPTEPYFIVPPGFRENTFFVGMKEELKLLDQNLLNKRRPGRTTCVLLHGPAGSGKSHLARQFVNKNRTKFKGGVFWINAKLKDELYKDYWQIAQKVVSKDSPELRISGGGEGKSFVDVVRKWFESCSGWLIVLDGVIIDNEEDTSDLQHFIPNSPNSSLLYISMAKGIESKERLLRPVSVKVSPLKESDARKLLFKEIGKTNPSDAEKKRATELVKQVGCLPLAINAISHRLADTHERLETFKIHSYSADRKLGGPYHQIMQDLQERGHVEAYNLINILCFYGSHIPVEMIHLGLGALRHDKVNVKSALMGEKPDINNTFGILIRFALIERNEPEDKESMSSSRDSLVDPEPIDMLKVHSVVQNFCRDALRSRNMFIIWLGYAIRLFCRSYREADSRIKTKPEPARVSDYREYLVHGHSLRSQLPKHEHKALDLSDVRTELESTIRAIETEVESREPGSSQESVIRTEFQVSIFDRTSSSSSSAFSEYGVPTPEHRPPPLPLGNESLYGMPLGNSSFDSPRSIGTASPGYEPRIVDHSPRTRLPLGYIYDHEQDVFPRSHQMHESLSENTARPPSASQDSHDTGWQTVAPYKKIRKLRPARDLGNFRASPATPAPAQINRRSAIGSVTQPPRESRGRLSGSSDAITSLTAVHHASPPPSRGGGFIWSRGSSSRSPAPSRQTYAKVAAGQLDRPSSSHQSNDIYNTTPREEMLSSSPPTNADRGRLREQSSSQPGLFEQSPLRAQYAASSVYSSVQPNESTFHLQSPQLSGQESMRPRAGSNRQLSPSQYQIQQENISPGHRRPTVSGRNPAPLPIDSDVSVTYKRRSSPSASPAYYPPFAPQISSPPADPNTYADNQHSPFSPTYPISASFPPGYYSQPTSRVHSQQSHTSVVTEPPLPYPSSSRTRLPDGSPSHKSPKLANSHPIPQRSDSLAHRISLPNTAAPHSDPALLSHTGGWASYPNIHYPPGSRSDYSPPAAFSMSRGSSGNNSFLHDDHTHNYGSNTSFDLSSEIRFGEYDEPVRAMDVRRRDRERYERLLMAEEEARRRRARGEDAPRGLRLWSSGEELDGGGPRRGSVPYPETNLIPTESSPAVLEAMVEGRRRMLDNVDEVGMGRGMEVDR